jgi:hypothetical protein
MPAAGVSVAHAASTDATEGPASHILAAPKVALAAATSDLKLVLAKVGSDPGLGAAAANAGQKFEILALPRNLADNVVASNGATSGLPGTVVDAGRQAATNFLAEAKQASLAADPNFSLENNIVSRALQGLADFTFWLTNAGTPGFVFPGPLPTGFDPATYTSLFVVFRNLVNVAVLPLTVGNLLITGQFDDIAPFIKNTITTLVGSVFQGLPTTFVQTVRWVLTGQTPADTMMSNTMMSNTMMSNTMMLGTAATMNSMQANLAAAADPTSPTFSLEDNIVSRALQGAADFTFWLTNAGTPGFVFPGPLPTGFDPATYTSLFVVARNLINVAVLPLTVGNLLITGQFDDIAPAIKNTVTTALNSVFQGLPTTFVQTARWVLTGQTPADTMMSNTMMLGTAATVNSMQANLAAAADPMATLTTVKKTITTALTSVFQDLPTSMIQGLPTSFAQTVDGLLTGQTPADMGLKATENSLFKASLASEASQQDGLDKADDGKSNGDANTNGSGTHKPGGFLGSVFNGGSTEEGGTNEGDTNDGGAPKPAGNHKPGGTEDGGTNEGNTNDGNTNDGGAPKSGGIHKPGGIFGGLANGGGIDKPGGILSGITKGITNASATNEDSDAKGSDAKGSNAKQGGGADDNNDRPGKHRKDD